MPRYPQSEQEFLLLEIRSETFKANCSHCNNRFSRKNTYTPTGWVNTQLKGLCEDCHDTLENIIEE